MTSSKNLLHYNLIRPNTIYVLFKVPSTDGEINWSRVIQTRCIDFVLYGTKWCDRGVR